MSVGIWEQLAAGFARGFARAWFDEMDLHKLAEREVADVPTDIEHARRFRDAVARLRAEQDGHTGSEHPTSGGG